MVEQKRIDWSQKRWSKHKMIVNLLFEIKEPGRYIIWVSRRSADGSIVRSNKTTILITNSQVAKISLANSMRLNCGEGRPHNLRWICRLE